jgi:HSP20 family molecular chaperone IbpA
MEDSQLVIRGKQTEDGQRVYLHRGIAARQFQRSFVLAEGIEVRGAWLENGLLHVDLIRPTVEARVRTVPIRSPDENPDAKSEPRLLRARSATNSNV